MRKVSGEIKTFEAEGFLLPWWNEQPVYLLIEGIRLVVIFSSKEKLDGAMSLTGVSYTIKQVTEGREFLNTLLAQGIRVIADPYDAQTDKTRFVELFPPDVAN